MFVLFIVVLMGPGWVSRSEGGIELAPRFLQVLSLLALDPSGMGQFIALAGAVFAINRFDRHSPDEMGIEAAVRLWTRLDFRSLIQFIMTLVAATAPYRALTWMVLHQGEPGWHQQSAASTGTCIILWLLLLLAGPTSTFFGLQSIQQQWHLVHVLHKAGLLKQAWGERWGKGLYSGSKQPWLFVRIATNWLSSVVSAMVFVLVITAIMNPGYLF